MTPNVADFKIAAAPEFGLTLICPTCHNDIDFPQRTLGFGNLRDYIRAASTHARTAHAMSAPTATKGA